MDKSNLNRRNIQLHIQLSGTETETSTAPYPSRNKNVLPTIDQMKGFPIPNLVDVFVALCNIHFDLFISPITFPFLLSFPILFRFFSLPIINPIQKLKKGIDPVVFRFSLIFSEGRNLFAPKILIVF